MSSSYKNRILSDAAFSNLAVELKLVLLLSSMCIAIMITISDV